MTVPVFAAALIASLFWAPPATAQNAAPGAALSFAQAERKSIDLRQGMSLEEVQRLMGAPRRTALKSSPFASSPSQATLHWTYAWPGASSSPTILSVVFAASSPQKWHVDSWEWSRD